IVRGDRHDPVGSVLDHILHTKNTTTLLHVLRDSACKWTTIKSIPSLTGKHLVCMSKVRLLQDCACTRRLTINQENLRTAAPRSKNLGCCILQPCCQFGCDRCTLFRKGNGW